MNADKRFDCLVDAAVAQPIKGWDFSFVAGRITEFDTSWNYRTLAADRIADAAALVDMCTGGGEFLSGFEHIPTPTYATEGFLRNVEVARKRLEPRGVKVVAVASDEALPLTSATFDLVINRHGAYSPGELLRIMKPSGGVFLTQQVGSDNALGINQALQAPTVTHRDWRLDVALHELSSLGFSVEQSQEQFPIMSFYDVGALVFYLRAVPWQVPDFDVATYRGVLREMHEQIESTGSFEVHAHRFLIEAKLC